MVNVANFYIVHENASLSDCAGTRVSDEVDYSSIFSVRADRYRNAQVRWPAVRRSELECFAGLLNVRAGERVLDAPAGNGVLRAYLPQSIQYLAQDPAADFAAECLGQGLEVCCAPLEATGLAGQSFDVVASLTGLHHERRRFDIYAEWWRVLKPGGRLVMMDVAQGSAVGHFLNVFVDRWNSQGHRGYFIDQADEQALHSAGFRNIEKLHCEYSWCALDEQQMVAFMLELFGLDLQPDFHVMSAELRSSLGAGFCCGSYQVPWSLTALSASKPGV